MVQRAVISKRSKYPFIRTKNFSKITNKKLNIPSKATGVDYRSKKASLSTEESLPIPINYLIPIASKPNLGKGSYFFTLKKALYKSRIFSVHMPTFSIGGFISDGQSHLLNHHQISSFTEPLYQWTNYHGKNIMHEYCNSPSKDSFSFQTLVQLSTRTKCRRMMAKKTR